MLEIKNTMVMAVFIFLKHNGLWKIGRFKLLLHKGINTLHQFLCTGNAARVHVMRTVVIMHVNCKGLLYYMLFFCLMIFFHSFIHSFITTLVKIKSFSFTITLRIRTDIKKKLYPFPKSNSYHLPKHRAKMCIGVDLSNSRICKNYTACMFITEILFMLKTLKKVLRRLSKKIFAWILKHLWIRCHHLGPAKHLCAE